MATKRTSSKKSSARGKRTPKRTPASTQKQAQNKRLHSAIARFLVGFFAVFLILTFFPQIDSGFLGGVREIVRGLFGFGYYIFPFLLLLIVFGIGRDWGTGAAATRTVLSAAAFLFLLCLIHLISVSRTDPQVYGDAVKAFEGLYTNGTALASGGAVGGFLCALLARAIGWVATAIFASIGLFVCVVLACGSTPMSTLRKIVAFFRTLSLPEGDEIEEAAEEEIPVKTKTVAPAEKKSRKGKIPTVLVDDRRITDDAQAKESEGRHRFLLPEEEQEEVFTRVPTELFGTDATKADVPNAAADNEVFSLEEESEPEPPSAPVIHMPKTEEAPAPQEVSIPLDTDEEEQKDSAEPLELSADAKPPYVFPPISLLAQDSGDTPKPTQADLEKISRKLETVLDSFKVKAHVIGASFGPTVTRYEVQPETGVRVKQIANLSDDLALHLSAASVRIENIPGKGALGVEIPNPDAATVRLRSLIENSAFRDSKSKLITALGEDVSGNPVYLDIAKMPHLMIAGATGMGKSVCMNSLIVSLLYHASPDEVKFIMIDPKKVEMSDYNGVPHLLVPVINDVKKAAGTLNWACVEMEKRYNLIQEVAAKNLIEYNAIVKDDPEREQQPYIVIFIDELADLMMTAPDDVETSICRLAQKARAAGIHLVIGTQRPSVDVITGLIKANIPSRIAFTVASQIDSRTILDQVGAEKLLGRGDMLYYPVGAMKPTRVQGAFVDGKSEVVAVTEFIKQAASASYNEDIMSEIEKEAKLCGVPKRSRRGDEGEDGGSEPKLDEKFFEALELAIDTQNVSTSMLQTRLGLGYARAARIVGTMEQKGYIGEFDSATKKRRILITREELMEMKMKASDDADEE